MSIDTDYAVLRQVLAEHRPEGWAVEFGVHSGYSLGIIAEHMPVIGFDSFEGLPEMWREGFPRGAFSTNGVPPFTPPNQSMLVRGQFDQTLPEFPFPALSLIHVDCDLYSSTKVALDAALIGIVEGTIIVFDEYHGYPGSENHEQKAWLELVDRHGIEWTTLSTGEQELAVRVDAIDTWGSA